MKQKKENDIKKVEKKIEEKVKKIQAKKTPEVKIIRAIREGGILFIIFSFDVKAGRKNRIKSVDAAIPNER